MSINDLGLFGLPKDKPVLSKLRKMVKKEHFDLKKRNFVKHSKSGVGISTLGFFLSQNME